MKLKVIRIGNSQGVRLGIRKYGNMIGKTIEIEIITNVITKSKNKTNVITNNTECNYNPDGTKKLINYEIFKS